MSKIGLIIKREYLTRVKKKSFIIMTIVGPLLFAGLMIGGIFIAMQDSNEYDVLVSDPDGLISARSVETGELECRYPRNFKDSKNIKYTFTNEIMDLEELKKSPYNISLEFDLDLIEGKEARMIYKSAPSIDVKQRIRRQLEKAFEEKRVNDNLSIDFEDYQALKIGIRLIEQDVNKVGESESVEAKGMLGFAFSLVIYIFILMYGLMVMRGVIEEKTNRIVEVIVSSVKPFELMLGKIIGIGAVGLTQFVLWVVLANIFYLIAIPLISGGLMENPTEIIEQGMAVQQQNSNEELTELLIFVTDFMASINWGLLIVTFICAFIGGFMLYGSIFAAIGSAVDSETETQQFMMPVTIPLMLGYLISVMMIFNPSGGAGVWGSFIPLTSPTVIVVRAAIEGSDIWWQILISIVILFGTALIIIWLAGRIYRTGILMYGKKASFKELGKWLRFKN